MTKKVSEMKANGSFPLTNSALAVDRTNLKFSQLELKNESRPPFSLSSSLRRISSSLRRISSSSSTTDRQTVDREERDERETSSRSHLLPSECEGEKMTSLPSFCVDPDAVLNDDGSDAMQWRLIKPDYSKVNELFLKSKRTNHSVDSLEYIVQCLVKNWEKGSSLRPFVCHSLSLVPRVRVLQRPATRCVPNSG